MRGQILVYLLLASPCAAHAAELSGNVRICPTAGVMTGIRHDLSIPAGTRFVDMGSDNIDKEDGDSGSAATLSTTNAVILKAGQKCVAVHAIASRVAPGGSVSPTAHRRFGLSAEGQTAEMENLSAYPISIFR